jgi:membrane protease YdiL (CAAX protease family)
MNSSSATDSVIRETEFPQYSGRMVLGLCGLAALPFILLTWVIAPALIPLVPLPAVLTYWLLLILNAAWTIGLTLWIVRREKGGTQWRALADALRLNGPRNPRTGRPRPAAYFIWLIPALVIVLVVFLLILFFQLFYVGLHWMIWPSFAYIAEAGSPEFAGKGGWFFAALVIWMLNMLLAEEIFFRGLLLPRMRKSFGALDWPANALLYGAYYLATPFVIPFRILLGMLAAGLARRYQSLRMALFVRGMEGVMVMVLVFLGISTKPLTPYASLPPLPHLDPGASFADWENFGRVLSTVPTVSPGQTFLDLRSDDLSGLDLSGSAEITAGNVSFNEKTIWPSAGQMPAGFDREKILELGLNPGLGVRSLHARGITGEGVGIAIIDQPLLTSHEEIAGRLRWYEELSLVYGGRSSMHGSAVSSLAVGRTAGVAPGADLYYFSFGDNLSTYLWQFHYVAQGIRRVLQLNQVLPPERRIRVISISLGWNPYQGAGWYDIADAVEEARAQGVLVVHTSMQFVYDVGYMGLDRKPLDNPDVFESYRLDRYFEWSYLSGKMPWKMILAPMNSRTTADPAGDDQNAFYRQGGLSWTTPWIAGMYALTVQVDPSFTPERFLQLALETGRTIDIQNGGSSYKLGPILDPVALIAALEAGTAV